MPDSSVRIFTDPDAHQAAFRDMQAESVITGRGNFCAEFAIVRSIGFLFSAASMLMALGRQCMCPGAQLQTSSPLPIGNGRLMLSACFMPRSRPSPKADRALRLSEK